MGDNRAAESAVKDSLGTWLPSGTKARLIKSKETGAVRFVKWLVAGKAVVVGTRVGHNRYIRVRPRYGFKSRGLTPDEAMSVAASVIDIVRAMDEPFGGVTVDPRR